MIRVLLIVALMLCGAIAFLAFRAFAPIQEQSSIAINTRVKAPEQIIDNGQPLNAVHLIPNTTEITQKIENQALISFAKKPLENIDDKKYRNLIEAAVLKEGRIFLWYRPNLTYHIDLAAQRRITKSKIRRAFDHWAKKSKIFTFTEVDNPESTDIFIQLATASEKSRMGEAGPDEAYNDGSITFRGQTLSKIIIKHAQITISSDYFTHDKLREYQLANSDQGFQTLVHELGHVLGIMGHSPNIEDCMYFQAHPSGKVCDELISEINTLAILYGEESSLTRGFYSQKRF